MTNANAVTFQSIAISSAYGRYPDPADDEQGHQRHAERHADRRARQRHDAALDQIPQREMRSRGAERHPDRRLAGTGHRPGQQQRRHVRARDQQEQAGRRKQERRNVDRRSSERDLAEIARGPAV